MITTSLLQTIFFSSQAISLPTEKPAEAKTKQDKKQMSQAYHWAQALGGVNEHPIW